MSLLKWAKRRFHDLIGEPAPPNNPRLRDDPTVLHVGSRAHSRRMTIDGESRVKKIFTTETPGRIAFANELRANRAFSGMPWFTPWMEHGRYWFVTAMYPEESRLDVVARNLTNDQRAEMAGRALSIILDMLASGYAHRDFHAGNLFVVDGQLKVVDFETLVAYPEGSLPGLSNCYDVTGTGLESPWQTRNMGYVTNSPLSVANVLNVDFETAKFRLASILKDQLHDASLSFQKSQGRHTCKQGRIYNSISLPELTIPPEDAQRDCGRRYDQFGITGEILTGKRVLDLGSNIGGMLFEAQRFGPGECRGIEFDASKVAVSNRVALFCGLRNVRFVQGDIDKITVKSVGGPYEVVMCLAVEAHVKKPRRMYRLLGELTREVLYFEGNSTTDIKVAEQCLRDAGFSRIEDLGMCSDDSLPQNNCRPVLRAFK
jgi:2-polyprenyl-3-methyl-5-hydroxy-6-metoxy-1,4-benzoquinol methylase